MNVWLEIGLSNAVVALILAGVAWLVTQLRPNPKVVFVVWVLVLVKLVAPPLVDMPWPAWRIASLVADESLPAGHAARRGDSIPPRTPEIGNPARLAAAAEESARPTNNARPPAASRPVASLETWIVTAWLSGSALWVLLAVARIARFQRTLSRARLAGDDLQAEVAELARRIGLRRVPRVRIVGAALPPLVWALTRRPTIVLPEKLLARLSHQQRSTLLVHELAHLKRRDHLVRILEMTALALYWWNPVAWWARRQIERAGEACCDAAVIAQFPERARDYAEALLATVEFMSEARPALPTGASGASQVSLIRRRLEMILNGTIVRRLGWPRRLALVALAMLVLPPGIRSVSAEPKQAVVKAFVPKGGSIEERLDRLEKALQVLTEELRAVHKTQQENLEPVVVKTVPENGATDVDPSITEIKVTFNKDMADGSWSWTQRSDDTFPEVTGTIHYEADKRTCVLPVKLEPGKTYYIGINSRSHRNFKDERLQPAIPYPLSFKTK